MLTLEVGWNSLKFYTLRFERVDSCFGGGLAIGRFRLEFLVGLKEQFLTPVEQNEFLAIANEKLAFQYLLSRYVVKYLTLRIFCNHSVFNVNPEKGIFGQPLSWNGYSFCISHCEEFCIASIVPEEHPVGLDLEGFSEGSGGKIISQLTKKEIQLANFLNEENSISYTRLWTVKESLSKILKTGMMIPFSLLEVELLDWDCEVAEFNFRNFLQYKAKSYCSSNFVASIAYPSASKMVIREI